jgi:UPF0271 protein
MTGALTVDISTELGEGFAVPPAGIPVEVLRHIVLPDTGTRFHHRHAIERHDMALLPLITSAHLACGLHSGDPLFLRRLIPQLVERGIKIGAHPSYPDVFNFGQYRVPMSQAELVSVLLYQYGALAGVLKEFGARPHYVKCHGALSFDVAEGGRACKGLLTAVELFDPEMIVVVPAGTPAVETVRLSGLRVAEEAFVDRGYDRSGRLLKRDHPKALVTTPSEAAKRVISILRDGVVEAEDGSMVPMNASTFCLHSDTRGAGEIARTVVDALLAENIVIQPLTDIL